MRYTLNERNFEIYNKYGLKLVNLKFKYAKYARNKFTAVVELSIKNLELNEFFSLNIRIINSKTSIILLVKIQVPIVSTREH